MIHGILEGRISKVDLETGEERKLIAVMPLASPTLVITMQEELGEEAQIIPSLISRGLAAVWYTSKYVLGYRAPNHARFNESANEAMKILRPLWYIGTVVAPFAVSPQDSSDESVLCNLKMDRVHVHPMHDERQAIENGTKTIPVPEREGVSRHHLPAEMMIPDCMVLVSTVVAHNFSFRVILSSLQGFNVCTFDHHSIIGILGK